MQKQFHSFWGNVILVIYSIYMAKMWLFDMPFMLPYYTSLLWPSESGDRNWPTIIGIPLAFATMNPYLKVINLPSRLIIYLIIRVRDYMVLYESYDDNSVMDNLFRSPAAVGMAICNSVSGLWLHLLSKCSLSKRTVDVPMEELLV